MRVSFHAAQASLSQDTFLHTCQLISNLEKSSKGRRKNEKKRDQSSICKMIALNETDRKKFKFFCYVFDETESNRDRS